MIHELPSNQLFYRVTKREIKWPNVLSGKGALFLPSSGNRYNVILQHAAYVCDELENAISEFGYYAASIWQKEIGNRTSFSMAGPLLMDFTLWQFTLIQPAYVIDVEHSPALKTLLSPYALMNPSQYYFATQNLANHALTLPIPGYPTPHPGLKVPAVRSRHSTTSNASNFVLFSHPNRPLGRRTAQWKLSVEFVDVFGQSVTAASTRVDWVNPRFMLSGGRKAATVAPPQPYALNVWRPFRINHV